MKRVNEPNHARFLTFSTYRRIHLFENPKIRDAFTEQLRRTRDKHGFLLYAWVLMPNHAHVLLREPSDGDLRAVLQTLKSGFAKRIIARWRELNAPILDSITDNSGRTRFWQPGGGYDRNIVTKHEFDEKTGYIHMNPVRAGLVERPTDWAWSSARWWSGRYPNDPQCDPFTAG